MTNSSTSERFGLSSLPKGVYFSSANDIDQFAPVGQAHYMRRAFCTMELDGILCVEGKPTVYLKDFKHPLQRSQVNHYHKMLWNQSTATLLVLQDPGKVYIFSAMMYPENDNEAPITRHAAFIDKLERVADTLEHYKLHERITTGEYYRANSEKFQPRGTVDRYLVHHLTKLCNLLVHEDTVENRGRINSFVGRLIFTCYLVDRGVISLDDYNLIPGGDKVNSLLTLFERVSTSEARLSLTKLFTALRDDFNGSLFEEDFESELSMLGDSDFEFLRQFFKGEIGSPQLTLGFWAYNFSIIPVETISAIYEALLAIENPVDKKSKGAFFTPRHLAEMVVEEAVSGLPTLLDKRFFDPSCGSGIFLVILFNRLADEWFKNNNAADEKTKIQALTQFLKKNLCGIDVNLTACRITCFSLYVALLDQFEPRYLRTLQNRNGEILPALLAYEKEQWKNIECSIFEGNFFQPDIPVQRDFDVIIGNPPWPGRTKAVPDTILERWLGSEDDNPFLTDPTIPSQKAYRNSMFYPSEQVAHAFLWKALLHLKKEGRCCMLLPSQVLLNKTDIFQKEWFKRTTVDKIIQLADYRRLLFEGAIRPCFIFSFRSASPLLMIHGIEYFVPKYLGQDPRAGKIPVLPDDCIVIPLQDLLAAAEKGAAAVLWKSRHTGSPRDWRLLDYLQQFPPLSDRTGEPTSDKPWKKGKGFKPWYQAGYDRAPKTYGKPKPIPGSLDAPFIAADREDARIVALASDCTTLRKKLIDVRYKDSSLPDSERHASLAGFHRGNERCLFEPPLVLINKGFNRVLFSDFFVFYQDSITGISGPKADREYLAFLSAYVQSRLAKYFQYHTTGGQGIERPEVKVYELLRLPFPMPDQTKSNGKIARRIVDQIASKVIACRDELEALYIEYQESPNGRDEFRLWPQSFEEVRREKTKKLSRELDQYVYQYFGLTEEEIVLVEDTYEIYKESATPEYPHKPIPTLKATTTADRRQYAAWLCGTLNEWIVEAHGGEQIPFLFCAESALFKKLGQVLVTLHKTQKTTEPVDSELPSSDLTDALQRVCRASLHEKGSLVFLRGMIFAEGDRIHILKPDLLGKWTRSAGLNDAQQLFDEIVSSQRQRTWK